MKAVALTEYLPISDPNSLRDVVVDDPTPGERDLLVKVEAISVNPVDTKVRAPKDEREDEPRILGWDAAGVVTAMGAAVTGFEVGDRVYYAGDITRPGCNAELQAVDFRIAARMPASMDFAQAAALPLTAITAWESLFERMGISTTGAHAGKSILIVGGAGGVGSIAIQLAKRIGGLRVIATASRPETSAWVLGMGAAAVINHHEPLDEGVASVTADGTVDFILCLNSTGQHWDAMCKSIAPQGTIASIVETDAPLDLTPLKSKSARFAWEFMFTRSMYQTEDMAVQGAILTTVAQLVDDRVLQGTREVMLSPICAETLRDAHAQLEQGSMIGKLVVSGWP